MSKITPKNLSYDTTLPPFLARLQNQNTNQDGRQDFHAARPKKPRDLEAEKEDEPVFFDESTGETLTKSEWEEREKFEGRIGLDGETGSGKNEGGVGSEEKTEGEEVGDGEGKKRKTEEKVAAIGGSRKRKAGKVVGGDEDEGEGKAGALKAAIENAEKSLKKDDPSAKQQIKSEVSKGAKKVDGKGGAKKGKKIKLSFGDDE